MKIVFDLKVEVECTNAKEALKALNVVLKDSTDYEGALDATIAEGRAEVVEDIVQFIKAHNSPDFKIDHTFRLERI